MSLNLTASITGDSTSDLLIALQEVQKQVELYFLSGAGENESSSYEFNIAERQQ